jgi:CheY-like chemotaxis protein
MCDCVPRLSAGYRQAEPLSWPTALCTNEQPGRSPLSSHLHTRGSRPPGADRTNRTPTRPCIRALPVPARQQARSANFFPNYARRAWRFVTARRITLLAVREQTGSSPASLAETNFRRAWATQHTCLTLSSPYNPSYWANRDAADTLAVLLDFSGCACRVVYDSAAGFRAALAEPPDCVLSDIGMPGMDGYELARRLRAEPALAGVPLMAVTGYADATHQRLALEAGYDHTFAKGNDPAAILDVLAKIRDGRGPAAG